MVGREQYLESIARFTVLCTGKLQVFRGVMLGSMWWSFKYCPVGSGPGHLLLLTVLCFCDVVLQ